MWYKADGSISFHRMKAEWMMIPSNDGVDYRTWGKKRRLRCVALRDWWFNHRYLHADNTAYFSDHPFFSQISHPYHLESWNNFHIMSLRSDVRKYHLYFSCYVVWYSQVDFWFWYWYHDVDISAMWCDTPHALNPILISHLSSSFH